MALCEAAADHGVEVGDVKGGRRRGHLHCDCSGTSAWHHARRWGRVGRTKTDRSSWKGPSPELGKRGAITLTLLEGLTVSTSDKSQRVSLQDTSVSPPHTLVPHGD